MNSVKLYKKIIKDFKKNRVCPDYQKNIVSLFNSYEGDGKIIEAIGGLSFIDRDMGGLSFPQGGELSIKNELGGL